MAVINTIIDKEKNVRELLEKLRTALNNGRVEYNKNTNHWAYITNLSYAETKLKEILDYIDSGPEP